MRKRHRTNEELLAEVLEGLPDRMTPQRTPTHVVRFSIRADHRDDVCEFVRQLQEVFGARIHIRGAPRENRKREWTVTGTYQRR